jgi:anti-sigma regulatory factor (Ser/Thr protein kinase)
VPTAHGNDAASPAPADPSLDQRFDADALFALRSAVAAHAMELGAGRFVDDAVLVAHELSSNAVRHGGGSGRLRLWRSGDHLYCQVSDCGPGIADPEFAGVSRPSPSEPGGRGLWIARQLAQLQIDSAPAGTTVTAAMALPTDGVE